MKHLKTELEETKNFPMPDNDRPTTDSSEINRMPYWYVDEIRGVRVNETNDGLDYLVRWSGYAETYNSWEPEKNCLLAASKIRDFYSRMPKNDRDFFVPKMTFRVLSRLDTLLADKKRAARSQSPGLISAGKNITDDVV